MEESFNLPSELTTLINKIFKNPITAGIILFILYQYLKKSKKENYSERLDWLENVWSE